MTPTKKHIWFKDLNIGVKVIHGSFEKMTADWLRWCDADGNILLTGLEKSEIEMKRADAEKKQAEIEKNRANALAEEFAKLKAELSNKEK